jgi:hypothetical protein
VALTTLSIVTLAIALLTIGLPACPQHPAARRRSRQELKYYLVNGITRKARASIRMAGAVHSARCRWIILNLVVFQKTQAEEGCALPAAGADISGNGPA